MRFSGEVCGIVSKIDNQDKRKPPTFEMKQICIDYTADNIGKTLSLSSIEDGIQISIPFDRMEKIIKKGGK